MLNSKQRAMLKNIAAKEDAITQIGKDGLTDACITGILQALLARELVKISVNQSVEKEPKELAYELSEKIKADIVDVIGRKIILYKYSPAIKKHIDINTHK